MSLLTKLLSLDTLAHHDMILNHFNYEIVIKTRLNKAGLVIILISIYQMIIF
jgi:hypothetical protein